MWAPCALLRAVRGTGGILMAVGVFGGGDRLGSNVRRWEIRRIWLVAVSDKLYLTKGAVERYR